MYIDLEKWFIFMKIELLCNCLHKWLKFFVYNGGRWKSFNHQFYLDLVHEFKLSQTFDEDSQICFGFGQICVNFFFHFFVADIDNSDNYWEKEN